ISVQDGVIFDARTVVLSMAALFGGPIAAGIAGLIAGVYRLWVGGLGVWVGLINVLLPIVLGLGCRHFHRRGQIAVGSWQLLLFGLVLHGGVVASLLLLPAQLVAPTLEQVAVPMLLVLPTTVVLLGLL